MITVGGVGLSFLNLKMIHMMCLVTSAFKYKSSHSEDQIIGNKDSPRRTRSHFRPEESALRLLSMIEPTKVHDIGTRVFHKSPIDF